MSLDAQFDQMISCETREDLFTVASNGIARTVGTDGVRFGEFTMTPYVSFRVLRQDATGPDLSPSMVNSPLQNPLIAHYHQTRHTDWISIEDLLPGRAWTEHPLYKEVYRPLRLRSHIATALRDNGSVMNSLSLNRSGRDFTTKERSLLTQFSMLIRSEWRRLDDINLMAAIIRDIDDDFRNEVVEIVVLLSHSSLREVYLSGAARDLLGRAPELREQIRMLLAQSPPSRSELRTNDGRCYAVRTVSTPIGMVARLKGIPEIVGSRPAVERSEASSTTVLTQREVSVLRLLAVGSTASSIARTQGVSEKTVRKHLQNIYAKLNCHDRLLAVREAHRIGVI